MDLPSPCPYIILTKDEGHVDARSIAGDGAEKISAWPAPLEELEALPATAPKVDGCVMMVPVHPASNCPPSAPAAHDGRDISIRRPVTAPARAELVAAA